MSNRNGFTIVEVLVALLVLSVGLLGTFSTFASATRKFTDGHSSVEVASNAASVLERIRAVGCGGRSAGSWLGTTISYTWETEELNPQLQRVTVIAGAAAVRTRIDTFSAVIPC